MSVGVTRCVIIAHSVPVFILSKYTGHLRRQVDDMTESFEAHKVVDLYRLRLTYSVDVVTSQIDQHDMLCSVFFRLEQFSTEPFVLYNTQLSARELTRE